ncbi:hypothetical protein BH11PSE3_BH11PSE3_18320 [soil metagenome]
MERELTPTEARSGVISGRIVTLMVGSSLAAIVALGVAWYFLAR